MMSNKDNKSFKNKIFNSLKNHQFNQLALELFEFQMQKNTFYTKYAKYILGNKTPKLITQIPFLPIEFYKSNRIICDNKSVAETFISSGTSGERSRHLVHDLSVYKESYTKGFEYFYGDIKDYCFLALLPSYQKIRNSSLIYMVDDLIKQSNHQKSGYYLNNHKSLTATLKTLEKEGQKTILFGATYALLDLANYCNIKLQNTIIIETGGMKGRRKELIKEEVHEILKSAFNLNHIHSEYGMTESLSQAYSKKKGLFKTPPWMKVFIRDINDPFSFIRNKTGGINIIDLANIYSCPFISTQDLGRSFDDGSFSLVGRFTNADVRGCNLLIE